MPKSGSARRSCGPIRASPLKGMAGGIAEMGAFVEWGKFHCRALAGGTGALSQGHSAITYQLPGSTSKHLILRLESVTLYARRSVRATWALRQ
jgi:hypothetical protein